MKLLKFYPFLLLLVQVTLFSCSKKDKENEVPANMIEDSGGVRIDLVWNTGVTATIAPSEADLDLYLKKESTQLSVSDHAGSFESITFSNALADSDYMVNVDYFEGSKNVTYDIIITGITTNKTYKVSSQFTAANAGMMNVDMLKITKKGSKHTLTKL